MNANCIRCDSPDRLRSGYCANCETARPTPGPWRVGGVGRPTIVYGPTGYAVANATTYHGQGGERVMEANARLIAAAPDLFAALTRAQHYMRNCGADMDRDYPEIADAIAKAGAL